MSEIRDRLEALQGLAKGLMLGADWRRQAEELDRRREAGEFEIHAVIPGQVVGDGKQGFYLVREDFPLETRHGNVPLGAACEAIPEHIAFSASDADLEAFDPLKTAFIDTETTGLAGGTGTMAFLVGVGYFSDNGFRLDQCFMRDYDDEEPMLRYLDGLFQRFDTVVSYNGKSFDIPLLRTRFIQNRIPFRLDSAMQFDLLHAARRFWKRRLGQCNLASIEQHILGVHRHGDVPSELIPEMWFDYLRTRDAREMEGVFYHHKMDILSLVALTAWVSQCLAVPHGGGFEHTEDRLSLVRVHYRQKRFENVVIYGNRFLEAEDDPALRRECLELMALASKRLKEFQQMAQFWALLVHESPKDVMARLELAKYHEHRARNLTEAARICRETVEFLDTRLALGRDTDLDEFHRDAFAHRLERIQRKLAKGEQSSE